jgi:hypothetical protein
MSTDSKYILVDGKYILNADHVQSVGSIHTVQELSDKSQAPSGSSDLTEPIISQNTYDGASDISMFESAGSIELNMAGREIMYEIDQNAHKTVRSAMTERSISFSWYND